MENIPASAFQSICRTCLAFSDLYPIEDIEMDGKRLTNLILYFMFIQLEKCKELPQNMCKRCILKTYEVHRFLSDCKSSQIYLQSILNNGKPKNNELVNSTVVQQNPLVNSNVTVPNYILLVTPTQNTVVSKTIKIQTVENLTSVQHLTSNIVIDSVKNNEESNLTDYVDDIGLFEVDAQDDKFDIEEMEYHKQEEGSDKNDHDHDHTYIKKSESDAVDVKDFNSEVLEQKEIIDQSVPKKVKKKKSSFTFVTNIQPRRRLDEYICDKCSVKFKQKRDLQNHWVKNDHYPKHLRCEYCGQGSTTQVRLETHVRTHTGERPYVCDICGLSFNHVSSHNRHRRLHTGIKDFNCEECGKAFTRRGGLHDHLRKHHNKEKLACEECGRQFIYEIQFTQHKSVHALKRIKLDPDAPFQCSYCGKILESQKILNNHQARYHIRAYKHKYYQENDSPSDRRRKLIEKSRIIPNFCIHCEETFENRYIFNKHKISSECTKLYKRFTCGQCGKDFVSRPAYYVHKKSHMDEATNAVYTCEFCSQTFNKYTKYHNHKTKHTRQRKHMCAQCGMRFFLKIHLDNHSRKHTGERPFECKVCNKTFSYRVNLYHHEKLHLGEENTFMCDICGRTCRTKPALRKHIKRHHNVNSGASCVAT